MPSACNEKGEQQDEKGDGAFSTAFGLEMTVPASAVWIADMPEEHWSYPYVESLVELGIMDTDSHGNFEPDVPTTRAEFIYSLWLAFGGPYAEIENSFHDVHPDSIYIEAVEWALDSLSA